MVQSGTYMVFVCVWGVWGGSGGCLKITYLGTYRLVDGSMEGVESSVDSGNTYEEIKPE